MKFYQMMYDGAIDDLTAAIHLDPRHASLAHFNRALCYQALGQLQMVIVYCSPPFHLTISQALSDYSVVFLLVESPECPVLINRALLYLELGDWANSLVDFISAGKVCES